MAVATPNESSAVNLHPDNLQGSENREDRPKPAQLARDRHLESTTGKYKRRGTSNVTNVKFVHRIIFKKSSIILKSEHNLSIIWAKNEHCH